MSAVAIFLRGLRHGRQWDTEVMASRAGLPVDLVRRHLAGLSRPTFAEERAYAKGFEFESVLDFQEACRMTPVQLTRGERTGKVPIINKAPAGSPVNYEEYGIDSGIGHDYADVPEGWEGEQLFAFIVIGDSMSPDYEEGDLVYCRPLRVDEAVKDGTAVFARFGSLRDHTCSFKLLFATDDEAMVELRPVNGDHPTLLVPREQIERMAATVECSRKYWTGMRGRRVLVDEYAQDHPG